MKLLNNDNLTKEDNNMNNIPMTVNSQSRLPDCWVYQKKHFLHNSSLSRLPLLHPSYEHVLKALNISYRPTLDGLLEFWDSSNYKEAEEVTLPLYVPMPDGSYRFSKNYTSKVPTEDSITAAKKLIPDIFKYLLNGRKAAGFRTIIKKSHKEDFVTDKDHFKILPVKTLTKNDAIDYCTYDTNYYVVFDVNKIELNSEIELQVPKGKEGLFIGKNGWQVRDWCSKLGIKKIHVVGV